jgi:hypothetical protein
MDGPSAAPRRERGCAVARRILRGNLSRRERTAARLGAPFCLFDIIVRARRETADLTPKKRNETQYQTLTERLQVRENALLVFVRPLHEQK